MRIAQVAPLAESVPPKQYGGTERVVAYLSEALLAAGHEVTLFASGDSEARVPRRQDACVPITARSCASAIGLNFHGSLFCCISERGLQVRSVGLHDRF